MLNIDKNNLGKGAWKKGFDSLSSCNPLYPNFIIRHYKGKVYICRIINRFKGERLKKLFLAKYGQIFLE